MSESACRMCKGTWCNKRSCGIEVVCPTSAWQAPTSTTHPLQQNPNLIGRPVVDAPPASVEVTPAPVFQPVFTARPTVAVLSTASTSGDTAFLLAGAVFGVLAVLSVCCVIVWTRVRGDTMRTSRLSTFRFSKIGPLMRFRRTTRRSIKPSDGTNDPGEPLTPHDINAPRLSALEGFRHVNASPMDVRALSIKHRMSLGVLMEPDGFVTLEEPRRPRSSDALKETVPGQNWPGRGPTGTRSKDGTFDIVIESASGPIFSPTRSLNPSWTAPSLPSMDPNTRAAEGAPTDLSRSRHISLGAERAKCRQALEDYKSGPHRTAALRQGEPSMAPNRRPLNFSAGAPMTNLASSSRVLGHLAMRQPSSPSLSIFQQPGRAQTPLSLGQTPEGVLSHLTTL